MQKAVESLNKLTALAHEDALVTDFVPMLKRLATAEFFTSRTSACGLFAAIYARVGADDKDALRGYHSCCFFLSQLSETASLPSSPRTSRPWSAVLPPATSASS